MSFLDDLFGSSSSTPNTFMPGDTYRPLDDIVTTTLTQPFNPASVDDRVQRPSIDQTNSDWDMNPEPYTSGGGSGGSGDSGWLDSLIGLIKDPKVLSTLISAGVGGVGAIASSRASDKANEAANARNLQNLLFSKEQVEMQLAQRERERKAAEQKYLNSYYQQPGAAPQDYSNLVGLKEKFDSQFKLNELPNLIGVRRGD